MFKLKGIYKQFRAFTNGIQFQHSVKAFVQGETVKFTSLDGNTTLGLSHVSTLKDLFEKIEEE